MDIDYEKVSEIFSTDAWDVKLRPSIYSIISWCMERGGFEALSNPQSFTSLVYRLVMCARITLFILEAQNEEFTIHALLEFMAKHSHYLNSLADKSIERALREAYEMDIAEGVKLVRLADDKED